MLFTYISFPVKFMEFAKFGNASHQYETCTCIFMITFSIFFRISFGVCGRFTAAELLSFSLSLFIVCIWVLTGHWLLMDGKYSAIVSVATKVTRKWRQMWCSVSAMGMGLCVAFIAFIRLPSLKVSTLLLTGLLVYDVFWVFFSSYIFNTNVMVKVSKV